MKDWVALNTSGIVVGAFSAEQDFVDNFETVVVDDRSKSTPSWYADGAEFYDVTGVEPRPLLGWYRTSAGAWADGNPSLTADRYRIPADGSTAALVTFRQKGPKTPSKVTFNVNGVDAEDNLANGEAVLTVTSVNPGDVIAVSAAGQVINIRVED